MERTPITGIGKRSLSLPRISHLLRVILISLGMLAMIVGVVVALAFAIVSLRDDNSVTSVDVPVAVISAPPVVMEASVETDDMTIVTPAAVAETDPVPIQAPAAEVDLFAISFPILDVKWEEVKDLSTIPAYENTFSEGHALWSSDEGTAWAAQFFSELSRIQFVNTHPTSVARDKDGSAEAGFIRIASVSVESDGWISKIEMHTWLFLSLDKGSSWMQLASYPIPEDWPDTAPIHMILVVDEGDSVILFLHPAGFEPWMMTKINKPLS